MNNYYELNPPMYSSNSTYSGLYNETSALDTNSNLKNKTIQIQEELVKEMNEDFDIAYEERPELKQVQTLLENYRKINDKYMKDSRDLKEAMKQSEREIEILNSHCNYIRKLQDTYTSESDDSFSYLVKDIEALSLKIKENNDLKEIRKRYTETRREMLSYLSLIKQINQFNLGTTCSLCLANNVDGYFNPCGHTACNQCMDKLDTMSRDAPCPFCKKKIMTTRPLFFI